MYKNITLNNIYYCSHALLGLCSWLGVEPYTIVLSTIGHSWYIIIIIIILASYQYHPIIAIHYCNMKTSQWDIPLYLPKLHSWNELINLIIFQASTVLVCQILKTMKDTGSLDSLLMCNEVITLPTNLWRQIMQELHTYSLTNIMYTLGDGHLDHSETRNLTSARLVLHRQLPVDIVDVVRRRGV